MNYMLLDTTTSAKLVLVSQLREVQLHARIYAADNPGVRLLAPPVEGRSFAKLTQNQLTHLIYGLGEEPKGDYSAQCVQALMLVEKVAPNDTPLASLEREAERRALPEPDLNAPKEKVASPPKAPPKEKKHDTSFANPERPKEGTTTALVWTLADELKAKLGRDPSSKEIVERCEQEGIKAGTASVQAGKWRKVNCS